MKYWSTFPALILLNIVAKTQYIGIDAISPQAGLHVADSSEVFTASFFNIN